MATICTTIIGKRFSRMVVLSALPRLDKNNRKVLCKCDCGSEKVVYEANLVSGRTTSCGCLCSEKASAMHTTHGESGNAYHGKQKTAEYRTWLNIHTRCRNEKSPDYKYYGGRGIKICDRWMKSFENFLGDMGRKPSAKHSIDRRDNNGNYEPSNCYWATRKEQNSNTSRNKFVLIGCERVTITEAGRRFGVHRATAEKMLSWVA